MPCVASSMRVSVGHRFTRRKCWSVAVIRRPKLGIALGSGSARGWAHIGVLSALAERGIAPEFVAGCSMGAMVGAAFAAGRVEQLETWALSLDWKRVVGLLDLGLRGGLIKGDRLVNMFQGQFVECQFSELMLPFAAVATDRSGFGRDRGTSKHPRARRASRPGSPPRRCAEIDAAPDPAAPRARPA